MTVAPISADTQLMLTKVVVPFAAKHKALTRHRVSKWKVEMLSNYVVPQVMPLFP